MTRRIKKKLLFGKSDEDLLRLRDYKMLISRILGVIERSKLRGLLHLRAWDPDPRSCPRPLIVRFNSTGRHDAPDPLGYSEHFRSPKVLSQANPTALSCAKVSTNLGTAMVRGFSSLCCRSLRLGRALRMSSRTCSLSCHLLHKNHTPEYPIL